MVYIPKIPMTDDPFLKSFYVEIQDGEPWSPAKFEAFKEALQEANLMGIMTKEPEYEELFPENPELTQVVIHCSFEDSWKVGKITVGGASLWVEPVPTYYPLGPNILNKIDEERSGR